MSKPPLNRDLILDAVWRTDQLPPYPGIVVQVEREMAKVEPAPTRVADILSRDPALCAAILRLANSAAHASRSAATNIGQAIVRLGLRQTRKVVLTAALVQRWPVHHCLDQRAFWSHSISVALAAAEISNRVRAAVPAEILDATFTAGLLHDLGGLVLARTFPEEYALLAELRRETGRSSVSLELEHWKIDHGEVGGIVACRWKLPDLLRDAVAFHHQPWQAGESSRILAQLINVADFLCSCQGLSRADELMPDDFDSVSWDALGLEVTDAREILESVAIQGALSSEWLTALEGPSTSPSRGKPR